jgi:hypothetical protein
MDSASNPYVPGAGRPPGALVGRDRPMRAWNNGLKRVESGRTAQPLVLYGLRGVGKTVLLSRMAGDAEDRQWIVAQVEAGAGKSLREALGEALHAPLSDLARPNAGRRLMQALKTAMSFKASYDSSGTWNFGIDLSESAGGGANSGTLETDLMKLVRDLAAATMDANVGLALLVDEAQDLSPDELTAICATAHTAGQRGWRVVFALAGLPSLPRVLAEAKSYAERLFDFESVEQLEHDSALQALLEPASNEGVEWEELAAEFVVTETGGYPYFIQQFGQATWEQSIQTPITLADARAGVAYGLASLDAGFFRSRWDRATPAEQSYLRAMATGGDIGSSARDIASRLRKSVQGLGPARANLINKGLIYSPEHGVVAFTVPGMSAFIQRQPAS